MALDLDESFNIRPVWVGGNPATADAAMAAQHRAQAATALEARRAAAIISYSQLPIYGPAVLDYRGRKVIGLWDGAQPSRQVVTELDSEIVLQPRAIDVRFVDREQRIRSEALALPPKVRERLTGVSAERVVDPLAEPNPIRGGAAAAFVTVDPTSVGDAAIAAQQLATTQGVGYVIRTRAADDAATAVAPTGVRVEQMRSPATQKQRTSTIMSVYDPTQVLSRSARFV